MASRDATISYLAPVCLFGANDIMRSGHFSTRLTILLIYLIAFVPRCYLALQPIPVQLEKTLPDDSYYYFLTAQNILSGNGPSVDGRNDSNGWHPLWLGVNLAVFSLPFSDDDTPVRISLLLGALADSGVVVVLYLVIKRFLGFGPAIAGALLYALNSMPLMQSINGLETGLAALLIAVSLSSSIAFVLRPGHTRAVVWGIVFGVCFLSRTDTAIILLPLGVAVFWKLPPYWRWRGVAIGVGAAFVTAMPWFVINAATFGSPVAQDSATAVPTAIRLRHELTSPDTPLWRLSLETLTESNPWIRGDYAGTPVLLTLPLWILGCAGLYRTRKSATSIFLRSFTIAMIAGGLLLILVHALIRWYPRPWYFVVNAQSLALCIALLWYSFRMQRTRLTIGALVLPAMIVSGVFAWQIGYYPWQNRQFEASQWLQANTALGDTAASMNSGIMGYYSGRTVINLDGVVNPRAYEAIQNFELLSYMRDEGVTYFVDFDHAVRNEYGPFMGNNYFEQLREVATIGVPYEGLGSMRIYRLRTFD